MDRFFLWIGDRKHQHEVTKEQYVRMERMAGFRNTLGQPDEPATASFSQGARGGFIVYGKKGEEVGEDKDVVILVPDDAPEDWDFAKKDALVLEIPREQWKDVVDFLNHPETGVHLSRPKRSDDGS